MKNETINVEEIQDNPYEGVNMGQNIKYVRKSRKIYQKELADALNFTPRQISRLEEKPIIEDEELLSKIANFLQCDVNFLKHNKMEEVMKNYSIVNPVNSPVTNSAENSQDEIEQRQNNVNGEDIEGNQNNDHGTQENNYITNNNCPIEELKDLFLKVLDQKDKITLELMEELKELREEVQEIRKEK